MFKQKKMKFKIKTIKTRKTIKRGDGKDQDEIYEQVKKSAFKQQRLPAWRPVPTIGAILLFFSLFAIAFIVLGIIILIFSNKIKKITYRYDNVCTTINEVCDISFTLTDDMNSPVMIYYQLVGFFQNHRRYVKSKSVLQLRGNNLSKKDVKSDCDPILTNKDIGKNVSVNNSVLNDDDVAIPCGLIAKTYFNDSFTNWAVNGEDLEIDETKIAYAKDIDLYNKEIDESKQWINLKDEHFLVWMRPSGLPNPKKLWGRIRKDLKKGDKISLKVNNNYDVALYEGKKNLILSTVSALGGKNVFLGVSFIIVGCFSVILAIMFFIGYGVIQKKEKIN